MKIDLLHRRFTTTLTWATIETLSVQLLLVLNQFWLYRTLGSSLYGTIAVWFSLIYLCVAVVCGGFDQSLVAFYTLYAPSKESWRRNLIRHGSLHLLWLFFCLIMIASYMLLVHQGALAIWYALLIAIAFAESIKKSLKTLVQLNMRVMLATTLELITTLGYLATVWGYYWMYHTLSPPVVFAPLLAKSLIDSGCLSLILYYCYRALPDIGTTEVVPILRWVRARSMSYINQMSNIVFNSNFLIPLFAYFFGAATISLLKVTSSIGVFVYQFLDKAFRTSVSATLATMKSATQQHKELVVSTLTTHLLATIAVISLFMICFGHDVFCLFCGPKTDYSVALLFFLAVIFENAFIVYERLAIVEERTSVLIPINIVSGLICIGAIATAHLTLAASIALIIATRISTFLITSLLYRYHSGITYRISASWRSWILAGVVGAGIILMRIVV